MVLYRRKKLVIPPPGPISDDPDTQVWVIPETLEFFTTYDAYLDRLYFYRRPEFISELSAHTCLTFFEAQKAEAEEAVRVQEKLPSPIKEPILRRVQFSTVSRLEKLVDGLYRQLNGEYFLDEDVWFRLNEHKVRAMIVEKEPIEGSTQGYRYMVEALDTHETREAKPSELSRDRNLYNKEILKMFVKLAARRDNWAGAPWLVRDDYVEEYGLPRELPSELKKLYEERGTAPLESAVSTPGPSDRSSTPKRGRAKNTGRESTRQVQASGGGSVRTHERDDLQELIHLQIGDTPTKIGGSEPWPPWHLDDKIVELKEHTGRALETWTFLQFFGETLNLDPFTFDDFVDALCETSSAATRLLSRIHAASLSLLVKKRESKLAFPLPAQASKDTGQSFKRRRTSVKAESRTSSAAGVYDNSTTAHSSDERSEMSGDDAEHEEGNTDDKDSGESSSAEEDPQPGDQFVEMDGYSWLERIGDRSFSGGGWQACLIASLRAVRHLRDWTTDCERILSASAPPENPGTLKSAQRGYRQLDIVDRILALWILIRILYGSAAVRRQIDSRGELVAKLKKQKVALERELSSRKIVKKGEASDATPNGDEEHESEDQAVTRDNTEELEGTDDGPSQHPSDPMQIEAKQARLSKIEKQIAASNCQRVRLLGKDRFFNRYWWFEMNGLPPHPKKGYSMGRLWVQGPSIEERSRILESEEARSELQDYRTAFVEARHQEKLAAAAKAKQEAEAVERRRIDAQKRREERRAELEARRKQEAEQNESDHARTIARLAAQSSRSAEIAATVSASNGGDEKLPPSGSFSHSDYHQHQPKKEQQLPEQESQPQSHSHSQSHSQPQPQPQPQLRTLPQSQPQTLPQPPLQPQPSLQSQPSPQPLQSQSQSQPLSQTYQHQQQQQQQQHEQERQQQQLQQEQLLHFQQQQYQQLQVLQQLQQLQQQHGQQSRSMLVPVQMYGQILMCPLEWVQFQMQYGMVPPMQGMQGMQAMQGINGVNGVLGYSGMQPNVLPDSANAQQIFSQAYQERVQQLTRAQNQIPAQIPPQAATELKPEVPQQPPSQNVHSNHSAAAPITAILNGPESGKAPEQQLKERQPNGSVPQLAQKIESGVALLVQSDAEMAHHDSMPAAEKDRSTAAAASQSLDTHTKLSTVEKVQGQKLPENESLSNKLDIATGAQNEIGPRLANGDNNASPSHGADAKLLNNMTTRADGKDAQSDVSRKQGALKVEDVEVEQVPQYPPIPLISELKKAAEGDLLIFEPYEWRYYDSLYEIDALERYLLVGGRREASLRAELGKYKASIKSSMEARRKALSLGEEDSSRANGTQDTEAIADIEV